MFDSRQNLFEKFQPFSSQLRGKVCQSGHVSPWPREASYEPISERIATICINNRKGGGCFLCSTGYSRIRSKDDVNLETDQLGGKLGQSIQFSLRPPVFNNNVFPLYVPKIPKALPEGPAHLGSRSRRRTRR